MKRNLPRRNGDGNDRHAWQSLPDKVADDLRRSDLDLRWEALPHVFRRPVRSSGQHEHRGPKQGSVRHNRKADPELAFLQWDRNRFLDRLPAHGFNERGDNWLEGLFEVIVPIARKLWRSLGCATEGRELSRH